MATDLSDVLVDLKEKAQDALSNTKLKDLGDTLTGAKLTIKGNVLTVGEHAAVQLSNISQISIQRKKGKPQLIAANIFSILGFALFFQAGNTYRGGGLVFLGLLSLAVGFVLFALYSTRGYFLRLELNSGSSFWLTANMKKDLDFLLKAKSTICSCVNENTGDISLDFSNSTINGSNLFSPNSTVKTEESEPYGSH